MDTVILMSIIIFLVAVIAVIVVLNVIQMIKTNQYKKIIDKLEIEKNKIDSAPIMPELSKIESLLKNEKSNDRNLSRMGCFGTRRRADPALRHGVYRAGCSPSADA